MVEKTNALKSEQEKPTTNDVANDSKVETINELKKEVNTPAAGRQRRKRVSELGDTSLVIATPSGTDGNRRTTRSQTRGTPAPAPTPAKKPALEKTNGSAAKSGRRGRPPKSANDEKSAESIIDEEPPKKEEKEETKIVKTPKKTVTEPKVEKVESAPSKVEAVPSVVDGVSNSKPLETKPVPQAEPVKEVKEETTKSETKAEPVQNSQEPEQPKEKSLVSPVVEKLVPAEVNETKSAEVENKIVNNATSNDTTSVNNHEQA